MCTGFDALFPLMEKSITNPQTCDRCGLSFFVWFLLFLLWLELAHCPTRQSLCCHLDFCAAGRFLNHSCQGFGKRLILTWKAFECTYTFLFVCCIPPVHTQLVAYHQCILPPSVNTSLCCCCQCCNKMHQEGQRWETFATIYFYCITYSPSANNVSFCWWKATSICNCAH